MENKDLLSIGKIVGVHGLKGNLKIYAESVDIFVPGISVYLKSSVSTQSFKIIRVAPHKKNTLLLVLEGIDNRTLAETLTGSDVLIEKGLLPELDEETWYWHELIGLEVVTVSGENLGRLESIMPTGSNDVYIVKNRDKETLVPALASVVVSVDLDRQVMKVDLPEGL